MSKFEPNLQRRADLAKLRDYIATVKDGQVITPTEIEAATGIAMDASGKALFRLAAKRAKREFFTLTGRGWEASSPSNAVDIADRKVERIAGALKVAQRTTENVSTRHLAEMTGADRDRLTRRHALLSTLSAVSMKLPEKT